MGQSMVRSYKVVKVDKQNTKNVTLSNDIFTHMLDLDMWK